MPRRHHKAREQQRSKAVPSVGALPLGEKKRCLSKRKYTSWTAASLDARYTGKRVYECDVCHGFHLTSSTPSH